MKVKDKTIIVTGAGSGLGRALVIILLNRGAKVIALDINAASLKETVVHSQHSSDVIFTYQLDIADKEAVEQTAKIILSKHKHVDGLINNAGIIQPFVKFNDVSYETIERVFKINLFGTIYLTKAFLPHLITQQQAHIINIASMGGFLPVPGQTIYCAAKAGVKLLTEGLISELTESNIEVTIVFPGAMNTNIMANSGLKQPTSEPDKKQPKTMTPAMAAIQIINAMEAGKTRVFVGSDSRFMDWLYRISPRFAAQMIYKKMRSKLN
ncbi:SDR family oxidoreductase [Mucilaginibacter sp. cycad4]|uniref:SDR family NAD(P)-dependent oxidoreductase n=1 Tax=Mucilaginibacter sp. cycad4 TaxID=3342096 RepID=UPI002AABFDE9|nr:SDR family oxidoreductase [Mucilaginibacter gossypii]WPV01949.1 SDR family oxidoreductase [Mucilaginibacter gossypii]